MRSAQQFVDYREQGSVKMAFDFRAEEAADGWSVVSTETRVMALGDATRSGMGRYWRLIVPGSGLLRRQWLDGIRRRPRARTKGAERRTPSRADSSGPTQLGGVRDLRPLWSHCLGSPTRRRRASKRGSERRGSSMGSRPRYAM